MSQFGSQLHGKSHRKLKGNGKIRLKNRDKKRHEMGGYFSSTKLADKSIVKKMRGRGGNGKDRLQYAGFANLLVGKSYKKVKIKAIIESKDNRNFARLNIITKGTVIDTDDGKAMVTNRPGREGFINAVKV
ncbi:MAG: 30S ribosomal protein S8e [Candidatus Micrarchaeaceae archaeon]